MRTGWIAIVIVVILIAAGIFFFKPNETLAPSPTGTSTATSTAATTPYADEIQVTAPVSGALVKSPLTISGRARGPWYFEASFPVLLEDQSGKVIAQKPAQAQGDWMTSDFVPFTVTLSFTAPTSTNTGTLVLKNDNPSGDPSRDKYITIPVRFR